MAKEGAILFLRRLLSLAFFAVALGCMAAFASLMLIRYLGERGEVSQVFSLTQAVPVGGGNYIGIYNAAITPNQKIAVTCSLVAWTPKRYVDLLDRQVWLWPVDEPLYAYNENSQSRTAMWVMLAAGLVIFITAYFLWKKKE